MKKYRVTKKGKIVFGVIAILFLLSFYYLLNGNEKQINNDLENNSSDVIEVETDKVEKIDPSMETADESEDSQKENDENLLPTYSEDQIKQLQDTCFSVFYEPNEFYVPKEYLDELVEFLKVATEYSDEYIIVEGNVNLSGEKKYTDWEKGRDTGYDRALVIKNYFIDNGISEDKITIINNGTEKPLNIDLSNESLKLNRRSDVFFSNYYCETIMDSK